MADDEQEQTELEDATTQVGEGTEVETPPVEVDESAELWKQVAPDMAEDIASLSPEARERILLKRLAAQPAGEAATGIDPNGVVPTDSRKPTEPPVPEIPSVDVDAMRQDLAATFGEQEAAVMVKWLEPSLNRANAQVALMAGAMREQDSLLKRFEATLRGVTLPSELKLASAKVPGAKDTDFAEAQRILDRGDAKTPEVALKLAVYERTAALAAGKRPSDEAKRIAAAAAASRDSRGSVRHGAPAVHIPTSQGALEEMMRAEARRNKV